MHLCVVSGTFHPEPGGPPTFLYRLLPEFIQSGHTVHVITYGERDYPTSYPYTITRISRKQPIPLRLMYMVFTLLREARSADAIFVSDYGLPVALINLLLHKRIILKNVGDFTWEFATRHQWIPGDETIDEFQFKPHSLRVNFLRGVQNWYTAAADMVITPSHYVAGLVKGWGIATAHLKVIYNALEPLPNLPLRTEARGDLQINFPMVLTVARLAPWKGVDKIIRAMLAVREKIPNAQLMVIGDGPEYANLQSLIVNLQASEFVSLLGVQPPAVVAQHLRAANAFVLFSTYEGLPHTVLEAMQCETPVIVSDAGGNVEVVQNEVNGLVVPKHDVVALTAAITAVLSDEKSAAARAQVATTSLARFSWHRLVKEYETVLR